MEKPLSVVPYFADRYLAPGRVYHFSPTVSTAPAGSVIVSTARSTRGWSTGRCTIGIRLLGMFGGWMRIGLRSYAPDHLQLDTNNAEVVVDLTEIAWITPPPPGHYRSIHVHCRKEIAFQRDEWDHNFSWGVGTTLWLQLDLDTGDVRLRINECDMGVVGTLPPPVVRPVFPTLQMTAQRTGCDILHLL